MVVRASSRFMKIQTVDVGHAHGNHDPAEVNGLELPLPYVSRVSKKPGRSRRTPNQLRSSCEATARHYP